MSKLGEKSRVHTQEYTKGHRVQAEAVDGRRVGNAGDTIAVVIISGLPVLCVIMRGARGGLPRSEAPLINLQKYCFSRTCANVW